jgi:phosphoribosylanthranilate isomerase
MVDVATGVESSPGRKDLERVAAFVREARKAARASQSGTGMAGNETCAVAPGDQVIDNLHLDP